jgi:hypothetical protein
MQTEVPGPNGRQHYTLPAAVPTVLHCGLGLHSSLCQHNSTLRPGRYHDQEMKMS